MQMINAGGVALHVRDDGPKEAPAVVFANSLGSDMRVWDLMLPHLPPGLRLVRFDKRGHGLSDCPPGPYAIADLVADAEAVCDGLALRDVTFVGLSIGGLIGQGLALARPDLVRRLVLMDTAARIGSAQMWTDRIAALRKDGMEGMVEAILDRWFTAPLRQDAVALAPWRNMLLRTPLEGYIGCCAAIAGADFSARGGDLTCPVMAMTGAEDLSTPPALVRATADLYGAAFHDIPGAGHLPCIEQPAEAARLLTAFMEATADD